MNRLAYRTAHASAVVRGRLRRRNAALTGTRVMMFHDLNESGSTRDLYSIPFPTFAEGIRRVATWAGESRTPFVRFGTRPMPGVAVTFDDGYRSTLRLAAGVFAEHGVPFHVFVTKHYVENNDPRYLSRDDLRSLASMPLASFGVHGTTHTPFTELSARALDIELHEAKRWLEDVVGSEITTLSYPHGAQNDDVVRAVRQAGFTAAACSACGTYRSDDEHLRIPRVDIWSTDSASTFVAKTRGDWDHVLP